MFLNPDDHRRIGDDVLLKLESSHCKVFGTQWGSGECFALGFPFSIQFLGDERCGYVSTHCPREGGCGNDNARGEIEISFLIFPSYTIDGIQSILRFSKDEYEAC